MVLEAHISPVAYRLLASFLVHRHPLSDALFRNYFYISLHYISQNREQYSTVPNSASGDIHYRKGGIFKRY